jgi:hypothetical protein
VDLVLIFVVLPIVLIGPVIWFVSWRNRTDEPPVLTSDILAHGTAAQAEIVAFKTYGGFLDGRPMVRFGLRITTADGPLELVVTQSIPRQVLRGLQKGDQVEVRVSADRTAAAIVL